MSRLSVLPTRISCSGSIFAMLIDECYARPNGEIGLLFGTTMHVKSSATTDTESIESSQVVTAITGFSFCENGECIPADDSLIVGVFLSRHDDVVYPSFRSVALLESHCKSPSVDTSLIQTPNDLMANLILVVNSATKAQTWIVGLSYGLWLMEDKRSPKQLTIEFVSLTSGIVSPPHNRITSTDDSNAGGVDDGRLVASSTNLDGNDGLYGQIIRSCLHDPFSDTLGDYERNLPMVQSTSSSNLGVEGDGQLTQRAARSIQSIVESELLLDSTLLQIQDISAMIGAYDEDIAFLSEKLRRLEQSAQ